MDTASYRGPEYLQRGPKAAILNSRQSKYPVGDDPWIKATAAAIEYVKSRARVLVTSIGMNTWEMSLALASLRKVPVIIVLADADVNDNEVTEGIAHRFRLDPARIGFIFIDSKSGKGKKSGWLTRDRTVIELADIIIPVSIRSGGNLGRLLLNYKGKVHEVFTIPHQKLARPRPQYKSFTINPVWQDGEWLIHFTRTAPGPWPDETEYDYYQAILRSGKEYCRSAPATLEHILTTGVIYGSGRNIRRGHPVVGFARLLGETCGDLFRYRARLVNPYFEPYGIAIRREAAAGLGIRPVRYGTADLYAQLPEVERPYFQNVGNDGIRWKGENEWRFVGDFFLSRIPADMGKAIVPVISQGQPLQVETDFDIWPLFV
jgi:hypothetical protein